MRKSFAAVAGAALLLAAPSAQATLVFNKGADTSRASIWSAADDGSGAKKLATGLGPRISPDGLTVAYQSLYGAPGTRPQLITVPAAGGERSILLEPQWRADTQAWSPDSRTIAAVTGSEIGTKRLVLIDVATGAKRTVASGEFYGVSFSPTGEAIAFSRAPRDSYPPRAAIYVAAVGGGKPARLTTAGADIYPLWGPQSIAFARQRKPKRRGDSVKQDLYLVSPAGGAPRRLTHQNPSYLLTGLSPVSWAADGSRLLADFGGQDTDHARSVDPVTGRVGSVGRLRDGIIGAALSHDGTTILGIRGGFEPNASTAVVTIPYTGGKLRVLVPGGFSADWNR